MNDLIEALQIFAKYSDTKWPTHCEHDVMYILVSPSLVSSEDKKRLDELGFLSESDDDEDDDDAVFYSYRFGSA
jgi:hypothetical protein